MIVEAGGSSEGAGRRPRKGAPNEASPVGLDPNTSIGVPLAERFGDGPIVPNDEHPASSDLIPYWCFRPGGIFPRVHRPEHFLMFDRGLPTYRRCSRCGATVHLVTPALRRHFGH